MGRTKTPAERFATMPADKHGVRSGYLMVLALAPGKVERLNACGRDIRLRLAGAVSDEAGTRRNEVTS